LSPGPSPAQPGAFAASWDLPDTTGGSSGTSGRLPPPLTCLLHKEAFAWTPEAAEAFIALKQALSTGPVLQISDFKRQIVVDCDASGTGFGAILHQGGGPLAFFSRPFAARHIKLAAYERELISLVHAV